MRWIFFILTLEFQELVFTLQILVLAPFDQELKEQEHELTGIVLFHAERVLSIPVTFFQVFIERHAQGRKVHDPFAALTGIDRCFFVQFLNEYLGRVIQLVFRDGSEVFDRCIAERGQVEDGLHGRVKVA